MVVASLGRCERCLAPIYVEHVYKQVGIPKDPTHLTLIYKCSFCEFRGRFLCSHEDWEEYREHGESEFKERAKKVRAIQIEVDAIDSVEDLQALWASYRIPPILEDIRGKCQCPACRERYGKNT